MQQLRKYPLDFLLRFLQEICKPSQNQAETRGTLFKGPRTFMSSVFIWETVFCERCVPRQKKELTITLSNQQGLLQVDYWHWEHICMRIDNSDSYCRLTYLVYILVAWSESFPVEMLPPNAPVRCTSRPLNDCQTDAWLQTGWQFTETNWTIRRETCPIGISAAGIWLLLT